jgi:alpha-N-arabinofuranosidase
MPTYMHWDRTVLEHCWDQIDYVSAHRYSRNDHDDTASFLAEGVVLDQILTEYRGLLDYVRAIKRSPHRVYLSFDEWNVWYRAMDLDGGWHEAPHLLEEVYNLEDALVCAQYLHAFLRHADIVKIACIAQIVNVIAPVLTRADARLIQSIYWPFLLLREAATGDSLRPALRAAELSTRRGDVPVIDVAATYDDATATGCVSIVQRDPDREVDVVVRVADRPVTVTNARVLHAHPKTHNDWDDSEAVIPVPLRTVTDDGTIRMTLPAPAHAVLQFSG